MRLLAVEPGPNFAVQDVYRGWCAGLRANGVEVAEFNYSNRLQFYSEAHKAHPDTGEFIRMVNDEGAVRLAAKGLEAVCYEYWPDVILVVSGFYIPPDMYALLRARGHRVVLLCTESPYEDDRQIERAPLVDAVILNDPTNLERFRAVNPNCWYIPHAYNPAVHYRRPATEQFRSDFCIVGTGYPSRTRFLEAVDWSGIDVALAGNWQWVTDDSPLRKFIAHDVDRCVENSDAVEMYSSTLASANLYRREAEAGTADGWAMGPREVELAACETFFLREPRGEGDEVLPMLPTFTSPAEFEDKLRWWLHHPAERADVTRQAKAAIAGRTFANHAADLLRLL